MATLLFPIIGSAIGKAVGAGATFSLFGASVTGAAIGGAIGTAIGGIVDSTFLYPSLFNRGGSQDIQGARIDDVRLQTASEGSPINWCLGAENRVAGTLIWRSKLFSREVENEYGSGGKKGSKSKVTTTVWSCHVAIAIAEGDIAGVEKIWAGAKVIYDANGGNPIYSKDLYENITIYNGTHTQLPDPLIQTYQGVEWTPAFRGTAYIVIDNLQLSEFGNAIPQFTFHVKGHNSLTLQNCIRKIMYRAGLNDNFINVNAIDPTIVVRGYAITGLHQPNKLLEPLMLQYNLTTRERNGVIHFFPRDGSDTRPIAEANLGTHDVDAEAAKDLIITEIPDRSLPGEVVVSFIDSENDYQRGSISERKLHWTVPSSRQYELPLVMTAAEARKVAHRILWTAYAERATVEMTLPPAYLDLEEGDRAPVQLGTEEYNVRVTEVNQGHNMMLQVKGVLEQVQTLRASDLAGSPPRVNPKPDPYNPPTLKVEFIQNIGALSPTEYHRAGFYYAVAPTVGTAQYKGGKVFKSPGGADFVEVGSLPNRAIMGTTTTALGDTTTFDDWDDVNTVTVVLDYGELESLPKSTLEVSQRNWILIGNEIICFANATLVGVNTYELSGLARGLRDSWPYSGTHTIGERVVFLQSGSLGFIETNHAETMNNVYYRFVPTGNYLGEIANVPYFPGNEWIRAPFYARNIERDPAQEPLPNDVCVVWDPASRVITPLFGELEGPIIDQPVGYTIEFRSGGPTGTLRREIITTEPKAVWTAADQTSDGHTPGTTFSVRIVQHSPYDSPNAMGGVNRIGRVSEKTFTLP